MGGHGGVAHARHTDRAKALERPRGARSGPLERQITGEDEGASSRPLRSLRLPAPAAAARRDVLHWAVRAP